MHRDENLVFFQLPKFHMIEYKMVALTKVNTTFIKIEKKIFVIYMRKKR